MTLFLRTTLPLLFVTACASQFGASGTTSDGKPISATLSDDYSSKTTLYTVSSPTGWACSGRLPHQLLGGRNSPTASFPLSCNDGATGTGTVTFDGLKTQVIFAFALNNGRQGSVKFGRRN